jgi:hypothetical protein
MRMRATRTHRSSLTAPEAVAVVIARFGASERASISRKFERVHRNFSIWFRAASLHNYRQSEIALESLPIVIRYPSLRKLRDQASRDKMERRRRWSLRAVGCPHDPPGVERTSRWARLAPFVVTIALGTGCGSFFGRPEPSGLGTGPIRNACTWESVNEDCLPNEFCDAPDCKSVGSCVERPAPSNTGELSWVCGSTASRTATSHSGTGGMAPTIGQCTGPNSGGRTPSHEVHGLPAGRAAPQCQRGRWSAELLPGR